MSSRRGGDGAPTAGIEPTRVTALPLRPHSGTLARSASRSHRARTNTLNFPSDDLRFAGRRARLQPVCRDRVAEQREIRGNIRGNIHPV